MVEGVIVTLQVRPLLVTFRTETSTIAPTKSLSELSRAFFASLKDKNPETSGTPRLRMYPWSSILLTDADMVYACGMSKLFIAARSHYSRNQTSSLFLLLPGSLAQGRGSTPPAGWPFQRHLSL